MKLKYEKMPAMRPLRIPTKDKGFFGAIWMWLWTTRQWEIVEDWEYELDGTTYVIRTGFVFDGASIPKYFWNYLSPTGVLLIPGLIHDWAYKYQTLESTNAYKEMVTQKQADIIFRDVAIDVNGFKAINYIAYYALRLFGWWAWRGHRKKDPQ